MVEDTDTRELVAAVDLGSNSFHMLVARPVDGRLHVVDRLKEPVRLAMGLSDERSLSPAAQERALACLDRFGQRLRGLPADRVRAVGTNTLRQATNGREFLLRARRALGHRIEVIRGVEEARLIYLGASHAVEAGDGKRLVLDIGGGSTECVIGEAFVPLQRDSLYMGCVSYTRRFFSQGVLEPSAMGAARLAAGREVRTLAARFRELGWDQAVGASGTILAVCRVLRANGWGDGGITSAGLRRLRRALVGAGHVDRLRLDGLSADRAPVFAAGVAILSALVDGLGITSLTVSQGAIREGLLYDLLGRIAREDVRDHTVRHLREHHRVDRVQAHRVRLTAEGLLDDVAEAWGLDARDRLLLGWAARLHELGLAVAYSGYHKHGAYLLEHSDMPGFSRRDQEELALLVRLHRRKLRGSLLRGVRPALVRLVVLLRLAVLLHRDRAGEVPPISAGVLDDGLVLSFPPGWLDAHALTRAALADEVEAVRRSLGVELEVV